MSADGMRSPGIHTTAVIAADTVVESGTTIAAFAVIGQDGEGAGITIRRGSILRSHVVLYRGVVLGTNFHLGHGALIREQTTLGDGVSIGSGSIIEHHVQIGNRVRLHSRCFVPEYSILKDRAWLGPGVTVTNARYPNRPDTKRTLEGVMVDEGAVIGAAAVLLPGVVVGRDSIVGAGAVVVRDVPAGATVVGNPGRVVS